ncbi:hypothetical protein BU14_0816s0002 [Porphyra umbilicalis]|uniref:ATP synthase subunit e, mitochondrial n=1 Tax=Porphyra umbilicalis TaxID=2786 RepID=A0A1X6NNY1_PORUM|nr:hypothetical protein BU14_0816s0002 [Porphyra umbilicalis]|eukprot:OSX70282.1 hypothetical protein BU14_0816s0002 [Porphyra umbilicalis]
MSAAAAPSSSSLMTFARVGLLGVGFMFGSIKAANAQSAREASLKATLRERTEKLAAVEAEKAPPVVAEGKVSSGDPVQDWIDSLE